MSKSLDPKEAVVLTLITESDRKEVQKYLRQLLPGETPAFSSLVDGYQTYKGFRARGYPSNFIVDKAGTVRFFHRQLGEWNLKRFQTEMEALAMETAK